MGLKTKLVEEEEKHSKIHVLDEKSNIVAIIEIYENLEGTVFIDVECVEERVKVKVK